MKIQKKENLYIPMGIKEKNEYWEGFGASELKKASFPIIVGIGLCMLMSFVFSNILIFVGGSILTTTVFLILYTKGNINISVVDQIENMLSFSRSQKLYYYKSLDEWR